MALEMIGWGAAIEENDSDQLVVFISGYSRDRTSPFHFAGFAEQFAQTKLFLRDGSNCHYTRGIPEVTETEEENLEFLRYMIKKLGVSRVTLVSGSVGTHPTVIWGAELGVDDIHLIGAVTDFQSVMHSPRATNEAFREIREHIKAQLAIGYPYANLRDFMAERGARIGSIDLFYGLDDPTDVQQARNIADFPNVRSTVYHRGDHFRVPMFVQRRDHDLADRINGPVERPADLRAAGKTAPVELGYAAVRLD